MANESNKHICAKQPGQVLNFCLQIEQVLGLISLDDVSCSGNLCDSSLTTSQRSRRDYFVVLSLLYSTLHRLSNEEQMTLMWTHVFLVLLLSFVN